MEKELTTLLSNIHMQGYLSGEKKDLSLPASFTLLDCNLFREKLAAIFKKHSCRLDSALAVPIEDDFDSFLKGILNTHKAFYVDLIKLKADELTYQHMYEVTKLVADHHHEPQSLTISSQLIGEFALKITND